ncbi:MAG: DUF6702 family protein [Pseudomonadota bacterium]
MIRTLFAALVAMGIFFAAPPAGAHQQKEAQSDISLNERTGFVEIIHRFSVHDAEHLMADEGGGPVDLLADGSSRDRFANYVIATFSITDKALDAPLALVLIGAEIDGAYLYVYQETGLPAAAFTWTLRYNTLREVWPDQINRVNIRAYGELKTLTFADQTEALSVSFDAGDRAD